MKKTFFVENSIQQISSIFTWNWPQKTQLARKYISQKKPKRIIFIGTGSSFHVANWSNWVCSANQIESLCITSWEILAEKFKPQKNDMLIFISHRGAQGLTAKLIQKFKLHSKILICAQEMPTMNVMTIHTVKPEKSNAHTISLVGAMLSILSLFQIKIDFNKITKEKMKELKFKYSKQNSVYFIGAGIMSSIAFEAALKAREMARIPAFGYQLEEFLHGPSIALKKNDLVIFLNHQVIQNSFLWDERLKQIKMTCKKSKSKLISIGNSKYKSQADSFLKSILLLRILQKTLLNQALRLKVNPDINPFA